MKTSIRASPSFDASHPWNDNGEPKVACSPFALCFLPGEWKKGSAVDQVRLCRFHSYGSDRVLTNKGNAPTQSRGVAISGAVAAISFHIDSLANADLPPCVEEKTRKFNQWIVRASMILAFCRLGV